MTRRLSLRDLLERLEPGAQAAFLASVQALRNDAAFGALEDAIRRGDTEAAIRALNLDQAEAYFEPLNRALRDAFIEGGNFAFAEVTPIARRQGARVVGRLDATNPRAARLLRDWSSEKIVGISDDARQTVRTILGEAMTTDASPRKVALDIVGRINRTTGRREGGAIGLTSRQTEYVANARADLRSGDPERMRAFLGRKARDRRFDRTVEKAIREGRPVAAEAVERMTARYSDTLLRIRGETIARTESLGSLHAARDEGLQQMVDRGDLRADAVTYVWQAALDRSTRDSHAAMHGQARQRGTPFVSPVTGARLLYPGDRSLGAPASEVISCRCSLAVRLDLVGGLRQRLSREELRQVRTEMAEA